jgi:UDP-N-acetylmuramate: L-alanyl-gamma-D-glutamyl-meso-diaminopimelate ligase
MIDTGNGNLIPDNVRKIHLIAVCGTGMAALACMLKDLGYEVTGSDQKVYPPMSLFLAKNGIPVADGFRAENLSYGPDLVVVGNAVPKGNPEALRMIEAGISYCSMPQALNRFAADGKKTLLVTGTHGKTTTASLLAWVLEAAGLDPSFFIGGILRNFDSNYRLGKGEFFVIEGDEYDTAFFDKGPKFLHFDPFTAVLTGVEFDHADIYRDLAHVREAFERFISGISPEGSLLAIDTGEIIDGLVSGRRCRILRYGCRPGSFWRLGDVSVSPPWSEFRVYREEKPYAAFRTKLMGEHNLLNALSVIGACDRIGIPPEAIAGALETFEGVKRRQEIRGVKRGITVMDDFAHHPTAVRETLKAVRPFYPDARLIAVFEPRTNTSMRNVFQDVYPEVFDPADLILIRRPSALEKIPADRRFSSEKLAEDLLRRGKSACFFEETEPIIDFLVENATPGDLILIMSNGGFDNIHQRLLDLL